MNIASVNLAALIVFLRQGVRPRTWLQRRAATQSRWLEFFLWASLLTALIALIVTQPQ